MAIGATRRIATVHVELRELQEVRSALGGKVNDVVLCAATGALRELLLERGEDPPRQGLRAMVPVNIRRDADRGEVGNKVSSLFVELPVAEADPRRRHELVRATAAVHRGKPLLTSTIDVPRHLRSSTELPIWATSSLASPRKHHAGRHRRDLWISCQSERLVGANAGAGARVPIQ